MTKTKAKKHTDIKSDSWVDRYLGPEIRPYARLMRLDRPIGAWLLLLPAYWAIILSSGGGPGVNGFILKTLFLFGIGAVVMRGAGCIVNDLWDRKLDQLVERTSVRPLASGAVTEKQAFILLGGLLLIGAIILYQMSLVTVLLGLMVLPMIVLYPLMKRITWWPQAFLGLTFNFGALMGWAAVNDVISIQALMLYTGGFFWTMGYDTIYAHQDMEDDARIGIKSTALHFGENSRNYVTAFYAMTMVSITIAFIISGAGVPSYALLGLAGLHLYGQLQSWDEKDQQSSLDTFKSNQAFGLLVMLAAIF